MPPAKPPPPPTPSTDGDRCRSSIYDSTIACWRSHTCAECLEIDGCLVNAEGVCTNATSESDVDEHRYTLAIEQNLVLPDAKSDPRMNETQKWIFEATQATYCPAKDPICKKCIAADFWSTTNTTTDSRFCVGAKGCVCIHSCAKPTSTCDLMDPKKNDTIASSSSSSSRSYGDEQLPTDDECRFVSDSGQKCRTYRSCQDCLSKQGCRVSEYGYCERANSNTTAEASKSDYQIAIKQNLAIAGAYSGNATKPERQYWTFASLEARYCPVDDPVCKRCTDANFWLNKGSPADSRFCVGAGGCVCIANCVRADGYSACSSQSVEQISIGDKGKSENRVWVLVVVIVCGAAIFSILVALFLKRRQRTTPPPELQAPHLAPSAPPASPGLDVNDEFGFYSDGTSPSVRLVPSAPPTPGPDLQSSAPELEMPALASAPPLDLHPPARLVPADRVTTAPPQETPPAESLPREKKPRLELYGWISHRQQLIDEETRRLHDVGERVVVSPAHVAL